MARLHPVENLGDLVLNQAAFFLDDEDFIQPDGKFDEPFRFQRPGAGDLVDGETNLLDLFFMNAEIAERLLHIQPGLAGGHDAEAPLA